MTRPWIFGMLAMAAECCTPAPAPAQPPAPTPQAVRAYGLLVEGGCLAPDDSGLSSVQAEESSDAAPSWLTCLFLGGTVTTCAVPCQ